MKALTEYFLVVVLTQSSFMFNLNKETWQCEVFKISV